MLTVGCGAGREALLCPRGRAGGRHGSRGGHGPGHRRRCDRPADAQVLPSSAMSGHCHCGRGPDGVTLLNGPLGLVPGRDARRAVLRAVWGLPLSERAAPPGHGQPALALEISALLGLGAPLAAARPGAGRGPRPGSGDRWTRRIVQGTGQHPLFVHMGDRAEPSPTWWLPGLAVRVIRGRGGTPPSRIPPSLVSWRTRPKPYIEPTPFKNFGTIIKMRE